MSDSTEGEMMRFRTAKVLTAFDISSHPLIGNRLLWALQDKLYDALKLRLEVQSKREVARILGENLRVSLETEAVRYFQNAIGSAEFGRISGQRGPWHWKRCAEVLLPDGDICFANRIRAKRCKCGCWIEASDSRCVFCDRPLPGGSWTTAYGVGLVGTMSLEDLRKIENRGKKEDTEWQEEDEDEGDSADAFEPVEADPEPEDEGEME